MFGFFKRKKDDEDPLSDLKTVSRWMQELPAGDIYSAQEQVVQSLIQFNHAGLGMSKERLQVLMHLDEHARDMQYSLCGQYLRNPRMSKVIESRLWTAIHAFYWEITRGYHAFLMDFVANPGGSKIQAAVPTITARAIRGFADIFKWRYFRYEKVEDKLWLRLHNLYRISEFDGFQNNRFKLYPGDPSPSSCTEEYVQSLLLSPLGAGSLTPKQIEMVDHWLDNWSEHTTLDTGFDSERHFYLVDTSKGQGLRHIRPNIVEPTFRYLATDKVLEHLRQIERALKSGAAPVTLGLGEEFRLPDGYDLLEYVANEWAPASERERRIAPREPASGRWEVLRDLANICNRMRNEGEIASGQSSRQSLSPEEILDIKLYGFVTERTKTTYQQRTQEPREVLLERWPLHDRSETGLGIILKGEESDWVKVGKLLALRMDPGDMWHLAIIRRLTRLENNQRKVGLQTLNSVAQLVSLQQEQVHELGYAVDDGGYGNAAPSLGLIFPEMEQGNLIILEPARYAHGKVYRMMLHNSERYIRLDAARDKGDGWLMATYATVG
jgi:cyclic-di-GMP-binding protein